MAQRFGAVLGDTAPGFTIAGSVARPRWAPRRWPAMATPPSTPARCCSGTPPWKPCPPARRRAHPAQPPPKEEAPMKAAEG